MFERRLGCPKIGCAGQDIRHQTDAIRFASTFKAREMVGRVRPCICRA